MKESKMEKEISIYKKIGKRQIKKYLVATGDLQKELFKLAEKNKENNFNNNVWFRGIIEFSNICQNDCFYCGIRKGNEKQERFKMSEKEIFECLNFIEKANYGSVVYQSGELTSKYFQNYLLKIVKKTRQKYPNLGITISCGEQTYDFYKKLREAGADRYLLRIETSNKSLYKKLHPKEMSWENRFQCLKNLQKLKYQVGTGIMVGLPGQTINDLVKDLEFFIDNKFDMFGVGPYVIHEDTPLSKDPSIQKRWYENKNKNFNIFLNFLAILRILRPNVNIAAATACDVFEPLGRIKVLKICGNIIMPSVTPKKYRDKYLIYQNKPCIDEDAEKCLGCISGKIKLAGLNPVFGQQGTSPFYYQKQHG